MKLLIVESPAKCKTISTYLGEDYRVESSIGHIRDLSIKGKGGFGVDIENNFAPEYVILKDKADIVEKLRNIASEADHVYLATDPDREGEAISWHLASVLGQPVKKVSRIVFNEITKSAILKSIKNDRQIDMNLVHSQESRRILDRIIGFRLSSLMQQKLGSKSAGRVQSVALKLVVDREKEIQAFDKVEYWDIVANFNKQYNGRDYLLKSKYIGYNDEAHTIASEEEVNQIIEELKQGDFKVQAILKKERNRTSKPPFITSTLQQDASVKYNYSAKRVMTVAQRLYEGVELGKERVGLITYMRTDSIRLSDEFVENAKEYIENTYGENYFRGVKKSTSKGKNIQDAHEAIRPTDITRTPESIKKHLSLEEYKVYSLIYNRALASLMKDAKVEDTKVEVVNGKHLFNIQGEKVLFDGFLKVYEEANIDAQEEIDILPEMKVDEVLTLNELTKEQKFTSPPHRYTEARLIRKMEELGIGRPSTYAMTMETLRLRSYVSMDKKSFVPTDQGVLTSDQLDLYFSSIINVKYTAEMETILDEIALGKAVWHKELRKFYDEFAPLIEYARDNMIKVYPKMTDEFCPECGLPLFIRRGPFGEFTACSGYPRCKFIKKKEKPAPISLGIICPVCGEGEIVERVSGRGRSRGAKFYACNRYPTCKTTYSGIPLEEKCSTCGAPMIKVISIDPETNQEIETIRCGNEKCTTNKKSKKQTVKM